MIKKLLLSTALFASVSMISAQQMTNLVFDDVIAPTATTIELTFDYSGVAAGDVFEWQLFLADATTGAPDWGSGRNIAYEGMIAPETVGSGTQTVTFGTFGEPVDGEVFTWAGKITLADGTETGFNNTGNLVTVSSTASTADFSSKDSVVVFPNPVADMLNIQSKGASVEIASIIDITGKVVMKNINRTKQIDVSNLKQGFYFLKTVDNRSFKFLKK